MCITNPEEIAMLLYDNKVYLVKTLIFVSADCYGNCHLRKNVYKWNEQLFAISWLIYNTLTENLIRQTMYTLYSPAYMVFVITK